MYVYKYIYIYIYIYPVPISSKVRRTLRVIMSNPQALNFGMRRSLTQS